MKEVMNSIPVVETDPDERSKVQDLSNTIHHMALNKA
jgi:hypothetical protein